MLGFLSALGYLVCILIGALYTRHAGEIGAVLLEMRKSWRSSKAGAEEPSVRLRMRDAAIFLRRSLGAGAFLALGVLMMSFGVRSLYTLWLLYFVLSR